MFRLLFLGNGWADCVEIWYALGNPLATAYAVVTDGVFCTCARAHRASVSQERLGRLSSILVCELGVMNYVLNTIHGWGISARAHVHTAFLYLWNSLTDCVQIWYVSWRSLSTCFPQVMGEVGHLCTCARAPHLRISGPEWPIVLKFDVWLETQ